jgi:L-serine dehydratase
VVKEERINAKKKIEIKCFPYPIEKAAELLTICKTENKSISEIVYENENRCAPEAVIEAAH